MKKILLVVALVALFFLSANRAITHTVRLTVINKSEKKLEIRLTGTQDTDHTYFVRVPSGSKSMPALKTVDVIPDKYKAEIMFIELWDPVYGYDCTDQTATVQMFHSVRLTVGDCTRKLANSGEPAMVKLNGGRGRSCRDTGVLGSVAILTCQKLGR